MPPSLHRPPGQDFLGTVWSDAVPFSVCEKVWGQGREGVGSSVGIWKRGHFGCLNAIRAKSPRDEVRQRKEAPGNTYSEEVGSELGLETSEKRFSRFGLWPSLFCHHVYVCVRVRRCIWVMCVCTHGYVCVCRFSSEAPTSTDFHLSSHRLS